MPDDRLTAALEEIRERQQLATDPSSWTTGERLGGVPTARSALLRDDLPRLLGVVDAVLKLAAEWEADATELDRDIEGARRSPYASDHAQAVTDGALAEKLRDCAEALREDITRELTGEEKTDGQ